ncbi:hypothetical protein BJX76DRAFT_328790 [Aspergillus varians]
MITILALALVGVSYSSARYSRSPLTNCCPVLSHWQFYPLGDLQRTNMAVLLQLIASPLRRFDKYLASSEDDKIY